MNKFLSALLIYCLTITSVVAGLPPTTLSGQSSATKPTTFNFKTPYNQSTNTIGTTSLIETGNGNVLKDPSAEASVTPWGLYFNVAGANPVDGTGNAGGSNTITVANSNTTPLDGAQSLLLTKTAVNSQGQGFSLAFSIPDAMKGKALQFNFQYKILSGTYADNDMACWIYDVTGAALIQPTSYQIKNSGIIDVQRMEFQSSSSSNSYRAICHISSTSALAYSIQFDNFFVGTQAKSFGSPITDWVSYTPTYTGFGTPTNASAKYRREGDSLHVQAYLTTGTNTAVIASMTLPSGLSIDSSKVTVNNTTSASGHKWGWYVQTGAGTGYGNIVSATATSTSLVYFAYNPSNANTLIPSIANSAVSSTTNTSLDFIIPILGWSSSSQVLNSDYSSGVVVFNGYVNGNQALTANVTALPLTSIKDSAGGWTGTTYVVKTPGDYVVSQSSYSTATAGIFKVFKNGSAISYLGPTSTAGGSGIIIANDLKAGDVLDFRVDTTLTVAGNVLNIFSISKVSGSQQILAGDSVSALYTGTPPTGTLSGSLSNITYGTKVKDTHNAMSGATYTVPVSGTYSITATAAIIGTRVLGSTDQINILVNGSTVASNIQNAGGAISTQYPSAAILAYPILAGQTVTVQVATSATSPSYDTVASRAFFSIVKTGNF